VDCGATMHRAMIGMGYDIRCLINIKYCDLKKENSIHFNNCLLINIDEYNIKDFKAFLPSYI
jgi:hypothetical protein